LFRTSAGTSSVAVTPWSGAKRRRRCLSRAIRKLIAWLHSPQTPSKKTMLASLDSEADIVVAVMSCLADCYEEVPFNNR
jgi:hypothetical protein